MNTELLATLRALELELHHPGVRCSRTRLEQLLHPQFHEVGRSGRRYDRETVIRWLATATPPAAVESEGFTLAELAPGVALLGYRSAQRRADGATELAAERSSLWVHEPGAGWQLRYHQGTPADG